MDATAASAAVFIPAVLATHRFDDSGPPIHNVPARGATRGTEGDEMAGTHPQTGVGIDVEALYRRERDRIHAMCVAILRDPGDAEDAVQETFARVAARATRLEGDPTGYLVVVARNVCRDELRRRVRRSMPAAVQPMDPTPEETAVRRGVLGMVWRQLTRAERALLVDVFSGLSMAEIGARLGTGGNVVAQRVVRLRRRIRHIVAAPAALLAPMLQGNAMTQALWQRVQALVNRLQSTEHAVGPVLLGLVTGTMLLPQADGLPPHLHRVAPVTLAAPSTSALPRPLARVLAIPGGVRSAQLPSLPAVSSALRSVRRALPQAPDAGFQSFTASPSFAHDHTVFATAMGNCSSTSCPTLWRSGDGGATWAPLSNDSRMNPARIALPPSFPADPTVFAITFTDVLRSDDGGRTFRDVVSLPNGLTAAVDPTSQTGNARIFVTQFSSTTVRPLVYTARDNGLHTLGGLPSDTDDVQLFYGTGATAVDLSVFEAAGAGGLFECPSTAATCTRVGPRSRGATALSPTFASDGIYFDSGAYSLVISAVSDGSTTTIPVQGADAMNILPALDYDRSGVVDMVVESDNFSRFSGVRAVHGVIQAWPLALQPNMAPLTMTRLPDGHLLVAQQHNQVQQSGPLVYTPGGSLCSADDGATWNTAC